MSSIPHLVAVTATKVLRRDSDDTSSGDCYTATPGPNGYVGDPGACNAYYNYNPQYAPAVAVAVLFAIFFGAHLFQGIAYKKVS